MSYLKRKQLAKQTETIMSMPYIEISDKIRKVTYNTDFFERTLFERRQQDLFSFNFDSGKIGKFEVPIIVYKTSITSLDEAQITFVIQASKDKEKWHLVGAFRQLMGT